MIHQFATYEISSLLKEKGFDEACLGYYKKNDNKIYPVDTDFINFRLINYDNIPTPLYSQILDWLRERHNIHITIYKAGELYAFDIGDYSTGYNKISYYEIREKAIILAIKKYL